MRTLAVALALIAWTLPAAAQDIEAVTEADGEATPREPAKSAPGVPGPVQAAVVSAAAAGSPEERAYRAWLNDERGFAFVLRAGAAFRNFYGSSAFGGDAEMAFGGQHRRIAVYGGFGFFGGRTLAGLELLHPRLHFTLEGRATDAFRIGGQLRIGTMSYQRATTHGREWSYAFGLDAFATYDLARADDGHGAFFVGTQGAVDFVPRPIPEASLFLGVRLR
jgi:hypothetical protein